MYLNVLTIFYCTCLYMWMRKKNKQGHILYSQNRFFVYTVHKTSLRERERETLSVVQLRTSAFPFYDPISVLEFLNFSTTTFVYEYITRMACWLCWLQGEWWRELKKHAPETSHENQPLPQSPSDLCPLWGLPDWCYDHCWMPSFL